MGQTTAVELFKEWQVGAFLLIISVSVGFIIGSAVSFQGFHTALSGLIGGSLIAFLALSYLLYGR